MKQTKSGIGYFLFLLGVILSGSLFGNAQGRYYLKGYMGVQGGESFNYVVLLTDSTRDWLTGYSLTYSDADTNKKVKTYLTAEIDRNSKTLHLYEHKILDNNGFQSHASICLVNALLKWDKEDQSLSGSLITKTMTYGLNCSSGSITLINESELNKMFSGTVAESAVAGNSGTVQASTGVDPNKKLRAYFDQKEKTEAVNQTTIPIKKTEATQPAVKRITEGADGAYVWHSNEIIFEIWDGGQIDNDIVTIYFNGNIVLNNYALTGDKKRVVFKMGSQSLNTITITANNEGANPPNTADIRLTDGTKVYTLQAYNNTGKSAVIKIKPAH